MLKNKNTWFGRLHDAYSKYEKKLKSKMNNLKKIMAVNKNKTSMICSSRDQCIIHWAMIIFDQIDTSN